MHLAPHQIGIFPHVMSAQPASKRKAQLLCQRGYQPSVEANAWTSWNLRCSCRISADFQVLHNDAQSKQAATSAALAGLRHSIPIACRLLVRAGPEDPCACLFAFASKHILQKLCPMQLPPPSCMPRTLAQHVVQLAHRCVQRILAPAPQHAAASSSRKQARELSGARTIQ